MPLQTSSLSSAAALLLPFLLTLPFAFFLVPPVLPLPLIALNVCAHSGKFCGFALIEFSPALMRR